MIAQCASCEQPVHFNRNIGLCLVCSLCSTCIVHYHVLSIALLHPQPLSSLPSGSSSQPTYELLPAVECHFVRLAPMPQTGIASPRILHEPRYTSGEPRVIQERVENGHRFENFLEVVEAFFQVDDGDVLDHITTCIFVQAPMPTSAPIVCSVSTLQGILEFWPNGLLAHLFDLLDSNHVTMPITNDGLTGMAAPSATAPFSSSKQVKTCNHYDGHLGPRQRAHKDAFLCSQQVAPSCTQLIPVSTLLHISVKLTTYILCCVVEEADSQESLIIQGIKFVAWWSIVLLPIYDILSQSFASLSMHARFLVDSASHLLFFVHGQQM